MKYLAVTLVLAALGGGVWYYFDFRVPDTPPEILDVLDARQVNCNDFGPSAQEMIGTAIAVYEDHVCFEKRGFSAPNLIARELQNVGYLLIRERDDLGFSGYRGHGRTLAVLEVGQGFGILAME